MEAHERDDGLRDQLARQGQEALGRLAEDLVGNPTVAAAVARALGARERAAQVQETAMGVLGIPSAADIERLTRRVRSVSQRLEAIEDLLDRLEERLSGLDRLERRMGDLTDGLGRDGAAAKAGEGTTRSVESRLEDMARDLAALRIAVGAAEEPLPRAQERFTVSEN